MREIAKVEEQQVKRMNLNVPVDLHNRFKSITAANGENMADVLLVFIKDYVSNHDSAAKPKGRRL